jgi:hypothetical protein
VIDYLAHTGQTFKTGISLHDGQRKIESWFPTRPERVITEPIVVYFDWLNQRWKLMLLEYAPLVAQLLVGRQIESVIKMKYQNELKVWLPPMQC